MTELPHKTRESKGNYPPNDFVSNVGGGDDMHLRVVEINVALGMLTLFPAVDGTIQKSKPGRK